MPHAPQFALSLLKLAHEPPEQALGDSGGHEAAQMGAMPSLPPTQNPAVAAGHFFSHAPQFCETVRLVSQPVFERPSQLPRPFAQVSISQRPCLHLNRLTNAVSQGAQVGAPQP
jgi:hypothetical protein